MNSLHLAVKEVNTPISIMDFIRIYID